MENSGAYLFEWRPVDYGNGTSFAILVGGNTLNEKDVILNRGYDYAYTFESLTYPRPWVKVKSFAPRQIQRRLLAALVTLSRKVF